MSKEADQVARVKALRGGNRSVVTKLEKEALDLIQGRDEGEKGDRINRLGSIKVTLREKRKLLKELDGKVSVNTVQLKNWQRKVKKRQTGRCEYMRCYAR